MSGVNSNQTGEPYSHMSSPFEFKYRDISNIEDTQKNVPYKKIVLKVINPTTNHEETKTLSTKQLKQLYINSYGSDLLPVFSAALREIPKEKAITLDQFNQKIRMEFEESRGVDLHLLRLNAVDKGFGYKTANLMSLQEISHHLSHKVTSFKVAVPAFQGISDGQIKMLLGEANMQEINKQWHKFQKYLAEDLEHDGFMSQSTIKLLKNIQQEIIFHFRTHPISHELLSKLQTDYVIVRSTGKEDSDELANAGGNLSIPFVSKSPEAISKAIGHVLASYFSEKSIGQRLAANDSSLFTDPPFMPILLQEMVGENPGDVPTNAEIPRSGVLFTHDPLRSQSISILSLGLGNNEGVVNSLVDVDTYLLRTDGTESVIRNKRQRLVPLSNKYRIELRAVDNPKALSPSPGLNAEQLKDLKTAAKYIQLHYHNKPMDIEFTIYKGTLYLLQARPLESKIEIHSRSYLDRDQIRSISEKNKITGKVLLDGQGWVREINTKEDILIVDTVKQGLDQFLKLSHEEQKGVKAIIARKTAANTSHEIVSLRPKGIPVFVVENSNDYNTMKKWVNEKSEPLLIDPQRGLCIAAGQIDRSSIIKNGSISYPMPLELSVPHIQIPHDENEARQFLQATEARYQHLMDRLVVGQELSNDNIRNLLEEMAVGNPSDSKAALASLLQRIHSNLSSRMKHVGDYRASINQQYFQIYLNILDLAETQIIKALEHTPPQSMKRLYPIKIMEAMIYQEASDQVQNGFSIAQVLRTDKFERNLLAGLETKGITPTSLNQLYLHIGEYVAISDTTGEAWSHLVSNTNNQENQIILEQLVLKAQKMNILSEWINLRFTALVKEIGNPAVPIHAESILNALKDEFEESAPIIEKFTGMQKTIQNWRSEEPLWGNPEHVYRSFKSLQNAYFNQMGLSMDRRDSLMEEYENTTILGRLVILETLRQAVDTFDILIKAVTGSPEYSNEQTKINHFADMLSVYHQVTGSVIALLSDRDAEELMDLGSDEGGNKYIPTPLEDYLRRIDTRFEVVLEVAKHGVRARIPSMDELMSKSGFDQEISEGLTYLENECFSRDSLKEVLESFLGYINNPNFIKTILNVNENYNVAAVSIGSHIFTLKVIQPTTLEEFFTLFHQNAEVARKKLLQNCGVNREIFPQPVQHYCAELEEKFSQPISNLEITPNWINVVYTIPLGWHAGEIALGFNPHKLNEGVIISVFSAGINEHFRFDKLAAWGALLSYSHGFQQKVVDPPITNFVDKTEFSSTSFSFNIPFASPNFKNLVLALKFGLENLSRLSTLTQELLVRVFESYAGQVDWTSLSPDFFRHTLSISAFVLDEIHKKNPELLVETCENILKAIADNLKAPLTLTLLKDDIQLSNENSIAYIAAFNYLKELALKSDEKAIQALSKLAFTPEILEIEQFVSQLHLIMAEPSIANQFETETVEIINNCWNENEFKHEWGEGSLGFALVHLKAIPPEIIPHIKELEPIFSETMSDEGINQILLDLVDHVKDFSEKSIPILEELKTLVPHPNFIKFLEGLNVIAECLTIENVLDTGRHITDIYDALLQIEEKVNDPIISKFIKIWTNTLTAEYLNEVIIDDSDHDIAFKVFAFLRENTPREFHPQIASQENILRELQSER